MCLRNISLAAVYIEDRLEGEGNEKRALGMAAIVLGEMIYAGQGCGRGGVQGAWELG